MAPEQGSLQLWGGEAKVQPAMALARRLTGIGSSESEPFRGGKSGDSHLCSLPNFGRPHYPTRVAGTLPPIARIER